MRLFNRLGHLIGNTLQTILPRAVPIAVRENSPKRSHIAETWRKASRVFFIVIGLAIFAGIELWIAQMINIERWYYIIISLTIAISLAITITRPHILLALWLLISPFVALFLTNRFANGLEFSFDRLVILCLAFVFLARVLVRRIPARNLQSYEWLLLGSLLYSNILPLMGERVFNVYGINKISGLFITPLIIYSVARACITNKKQLNLVVTILVITGLSWAISGIYEHFTGKMWLSSIVGFDVRLNRTDIGSGRSLGPAEHYYTYGMVLALTILLSFHRAISSQKVPTKLFYYIGVLVAMVGLYFGYSLCGNI